MVQDWIPRLDQAQSENTADIGVRLEYLGFHNWCIITPVLLDIA